MFEQVAFAIELGDGSFHTLLLGASIEVSHRMDFRHTKLSSLLIERLGDGAVILGGGGDLGVTAGCNLSHQQMELVVGAFNARMHFAAQ
ncbi:hypothetical protein D3C81_738820 [compost metagenome]